MKLSYMALNLVRDYGRLRDTRPTVVPYLVKGTNTQ